MNKSVLLYSEQREYIFFENHNRCKFREWNYYNYRITLKLTELKTNCVNRRKKVELYQQETHIHFFGTLKKSI